MPRRSCLTARNDGTAYRRDVACRVLTNHVSRHCEERSNPENHSNHINQKNHSSDKHSGLLRSARNDGTGVFAGDSCFRRNDGTVYRCRGKACLAPTKHDDGVGWTLATSTTLSTSPLSLRSVSGSERSRTAQFTFHVLITNH